MQGVDFNPSFVSINIITGTICSDTYHSPWQLFAIYGPPHYAEKSEFWDKLQRLCNNTKILFLLIGDFNGYMYDSEKVLSSTSGTSTTEMFLAMNQIGAIDLGAIANELTL
ncbi:Endonuclease/exonuclease/phosphatase [Quillaja saponaria]|uniref:Endonuclease/exonuclease/phosphatase n=1 Tax=Quillaja saponaria TaxID=32244 RepID=A0AAD7P9F6_QUISA|nr:Endonuclease/exonuclease/phosphatase [Quillaja saponaria]